MNAIPMPNSSAFDLNLGNASHFRLLEGLYEQQNSVAAHRGHPKEPRMQNRFLTLAAAAILVSTASLLPTRADAMGVGTAAAIDNALADMTMVENAATICRWRYGRRYCTWVPTVRYYRPYRYRYYRPYRYYRR